MCAAILISNKKNFPNRKRKLNKNELLAPAKSGGRKTN
jgi:hypothetical protein